MNFMGNFSKSMRLLVSPVQQVRVGKVCSLPTALESRLTAVPDAGRQVCFADVGTGL